MPLDSHGYLVAQGWSGKGTGLRTGAISRPLAIPQKKNLAGLGKDRDEAFPFWDHLFSAASKSIQIKISNDSDDDSDATNGTSNTPNTVFNRTSTGILSNRRPAVGTFADHSGSTTPDSSDEKPTRMSLLTTAKRDAARKRLYAKFFRGPVLGPNDVLEGKKPSENTNLQVQPIVRAAVPDGETVVASIVKVSEIDTPHKDVGKEKKRAEKRAKKEAKLARKAARAARREAKEMRNAAKVNSESVEIEVESERKKSKKRKRDLVAQRTDNEPRKDLNTTTRKRSHDTRTTEETPPSVSGTSSTEAPPGPPKKKKKREKVTTASP